MNHTWEQLDALAAAHRKREAVRGLRLMVAAQGDAKSWNAQQKQLLEILKDVRAD